jgi:CRISPR-associated protein Cas2
MRTVICYDITCNKRLYKVANLLESYGQRQQYSLFELDVGKKQLEFLLNQINDIIDPESDSILCYRLCKVCGVAKELFGKNEKQFSVDTVIIL